jgi:hypothetical protein
MNLESPDETVGLAAGSINYIDRKRRSPALSGGSSDEPPDRATMARLRGGLAS